MNLYRWAPAGVSLAGVGLVFLGSRPWADEVPVIAAVGWAAAAAGLLIWFVRAGLRRLVSTVTGAVLLLALVTAVAADGGGAYRVLTVAVAGLGALLAIALAVRAPSPPGADGPRPVDPWTALDRGEDPTDVPPTKSEPT